MSVIEFPVGDAGLERAGRIAFLRDVLAQKFPEPARQSSAVWPTGLFNLDAREGGLRKGALTEIVGASSAGGLFIEAILAQLETQSSYAALIDAGSSFEPENGEAVALKRLLWVMCSNPKHAVKAADLLLRDGNLSLVMLDFQTVPLKEIRRIPANTWHRFQRIVEETSTAFVVLSSQPLAEGAKVRIAIRNRWKLKDMCERRYELLQRLHAQVYVRSEFPNIPEAQQFTG